MEMGESDVERCSSTERVPVTVRKRHQSWEEDVLIFPSAGVPKLWRAHPIHFLNMSSRLFPLVFYLD